MPASLSKLPKRTISCWAITDNTLEHLPGSPGLGNGKKRLRLDVDAVELIEAAPGPGEGQACALRVTPAAPEKTGRSAFEELAHHDVVHLRGAVEDHALLGQGLQESLPPHMGASRFYAEPALAKSLVVSVFPVPAGPDQGHCTMGQAYKQST